MTDTAERIVKLAERFDPMPSIYSGKWGKWYDRRAPITSALAIATPGALLGAAVDLFDFALAGKGWEVEAIRFSKAIRFSIGVGKWEATVINHRLDDWPRVSGTGPTAAAALLAAMEEI